MSGFNHNTDPLQTLGTERLHLEASFTTVSGVPVLQESNIPGVAVSNTAVGAYRLTWPTGTVPANGAKAKVQVSIGNTSAADLTVLYNKANLVSSGQLDIYVRSAGSANDPAAAEVSVAIVFPNSSKLP